MPRVPPDPFPQLLTLREVCHVLRRSRWSIYADVRAGRIRAMKVGPRGDLRFRPADLAAFLEAARVPAPAPAA